MIASHMTWDFFRFVLPAVGLLVVAEPWAQAVSAAKDDSTVVVGGVSFSGIMQVAGSDLELVGAGILRWKLLFRPYASAFYLPPGTPPDRWNEDITKCLTIHYLLGIAGEKFGPAGEEVLGRMYSAEQLAKIRTQLDTLNAAYVDIKKGDRYSLVYHPAEGTTLLHNGEPIVTLAGEEFARLYFSVWLGSDPVSADLRDELLGGT